MSGCMRGLWRGRRRAVVGGWLRGGRHLLGEARAAARLPRVHALLDGPTPGREPLGAPRHLRCECRAVELLVPELLAPLKLTPLMALLLLERSHVEAFALLRVTEWGCAGRP